MPGLKPCGRKFVDSSSIPMMRSLYSQYSDSRFEDLKYLEVEKGMMQVCDPMRVLFRGEPFVLV